MIRQTARILCRVLQRRPYFLSKPFFYQPFWVINKNHFTFSQQLQVKQSELNGDGFYMQQLFTGCLAEYAYYIESKGEVMIIDPLRDVEPYIQLAKQRGAQIKYVALTHFHADFVAGHHSLKREGAKIIMGPLANASYVDKVLNDEEEVQLGDIRIKALHTPGHTQESTCFLLLDKSGQKHSVYTGDTLFLGEVGRPDLAVSSNITVHDLAAMLYDSLQKHILTLPDSTIIFPGHGAGSACGKNISKGYSCSIGTQKQNNYALQPMDKEHFIEVVTNELPTPPQYFFFNATMNRRDDVSDVEKIINKSLKYLSPQQVEKQLKEGTLVLDCRTDISSGFIPGSINISANMPVASWVGQLFKANTPVILITEPGNEEQIIIRLARIGYDNVLGVLLGGIDSWKQAGLPLQKANLLPAQEFVEKSGSGFLVDIRTKSEWKQGVLKNANKIELVELEKNLNLLPQDKEIYIYCGTGVRAKIGITLLEKHNIRNVVACKVGYQEILRETNALHT